MDACRSAGDPTVAPAGRPAADPLRPEDPSELGRYRVLGRLGEGGMGTVYLGSAPDGRLVAIKMIRAEVAGVPTFRARFRREAELARRVARFCTAELLEAVDPPGAPPFIVTEFVDGPTLAGAVAAGGPLGAADLERVAVSVAAALTAIHGAGLVHRDLKPANVLLSSLGPRVIDFGIAHAADTTQVTRDSILGTPAFMAPEQALAQAVTGAADVWAWGGLVTFAGTGRPPFGDGPPEAQIFRIVHGDPNLDGLDPALGAVVRRAMSRRSADRPTAQDLLRQLVTLGVEVPGPARPALTLAAPGRGAPRPVGAPEAAPDTSTSPAAISANPVGTSTSPAATSISPVGTPAAGPRPAPDRRPSRGLLVAALAGIILVLVGAWLLAQAPPADRRDVSDGPGHTTVPDLVGRSEADARSGLATAGLEMTLQENTGPSTVGPGLVESTDPPGGTQVAYGTPVTITVVSRQVAVPDVVGQGTAAATAALRDYGFDVVEERRPGSGPAGVVIAQLPRAGVVSRGTTVTITVSQAGSNGGPTITPTPPDPTGS